MIEISKEAELKIKNSMSIASGKVPRISLKQGGCAGNMLILLLEVPSNTDIFKESSGIKFTISKEAEQFVDDIYIYVTNSLGSEILIKNREAKTCRCGKSFKI
jgi:Fe-S cluster assembly iron-binding protein IscA